MAPDSRKQNKSSTVKRARTIVAWALLTASAAGWPIPAFTLAKDEPQFALGLSWAAIIIESANLLTTSQVSENQDD